MHFADALRQIVEESTELSTSAPHSTIVNRPDEVRAARQPQLVHSTDE